MKAFLTITALLLSVQSFAGFSFSYFDLINEDYCPGAYEVNGKDLCICTENDTSVLNYKNLQWVSIDPNEGPAIISAIDLNIIPDDSTNWAYAYKKRLVANGKTVGYAEIALATNSEAETSWKITTIVNLNGDVVSIQIK